jgi:hypothetical protein
VSIGYEMSVFTRSAHLKPCPEAKVGRGEGAHYSAPEVRGDIRPRELVVGPACEESVCEKVCAVRVHTVRVHAVSAATTGTVSVKERV